MSQSARAELVKIAHMYREKRYDECIKEAKSKLKKSPNSLHLLNYQAMAYSALKKDKEALQSYENIIKKDPSLAGPYYNMGIILKRNGRTEEAIESYRKAISLKPDYVQAYNNLGVLYKDNKPLGMPHFPNNVPQSQGMYYCGIGSGNAIGRHIIEKVLRRAYLSEISITGLNAEVAPGQWEFQVRDIGIRACDHFMIFKYILERTAEE